MGRDYEETDRKCPLCGGEIKACFGSHSNDGAMYYNDKCMKCGFEANLGELYFENDEGPGCYTPMNVFFWVSRKICEILRKKWKKENKALNITTLLEAYECFLKDYEERKKRRQK